MSALHPAVVQAMSLRAMRMAHALWHLAREEWNQWTPPKQAQFQTAFGAEWVPPRPSLDALGAPIRNQGAGRDFLFMHRQMIEHVNHILQVVGEGPIQGWTTLPAAGDPLHPVPRSFNLPESSYPAKNDALWTDLVTAAQRLTDPVYLKSVSIDALGTEIEHGVGTVLVDALGVEMEYGIHAAMHQRFGDFSTVGLRLSLRDMPSNVITSWDQPAYNSLLDFYSAHVHPWFWKIHVWIDDRITGWECANGKKADWKGAWEPPMHAHPPGMVVGPVHGHVTSPQPPAPAHDPHGDDHATPPTSAPD